MCVFGNHTDTGGPHLLPLTTPFTTCLGVTPRAPTGFITVTLQSGHTPHCLHAAVKVDLSLLLLKSVGDTLSFGADFSPPPSIANARRQCRCR